MLRKPVNTVEVTVAASGVSSTVAKIKEMGVIGLDIPTLSGLVSLPNITLQVSDETGGTFRSLLKSDDPATAWGHQTVTGVSGNAMVMVPDLTPFGAAKVVLSVSGQAANTFRFIGKE